MGGGRVLPGVWGGGSPLESREGPRMHPCLFLSPPIRLSPRTSIRVTPWDPWLEGDRSPSQEGCLLSSEAGKPFPVGPTNPLKNRVRPTGLCPHFKPEEGCSGPTQSPDPKRADSCFFSGELLHSSSISRGGSDGPARVQWPRSEVTTARRSDLSVAMGMLRMPLPPAKPHLSSRRSGRGSD